MTTKHTPGPWHVTEWPGDADVPKGWSLGIDCEFRADDGRDYYLATVVHGDPDELRANARLIAAAPDLLAALRGLLETVERGDPIGPAKRGALAAIAKAEGRS